MNEPMITLDLKEGIFTLNEGTLDALNRPEHIQMLINSEEKALLIRACEINASQAVVMPTEHVLSTEISGRTLIKNISKKMDWNDNKKRICPGVILPSYNAVRFDLNNSRISF